MEKQTTNPSRKSRDRANGLETPAKLLATSLRSRFAVECIDIEAASGIEGVSWERFQIELLNDTNRLSIFRKSRQVAFSFTAAVEAWTDAYLSGTSSIFVSISREEATEKIRYAKSIYEATRGVRLPKIVKDNEYSIAFANGSSIVSLPSRPPRGRARRNVYLDEFAHVKKDREIYRGALPVISKGGRLRIGSSPMGARGLFWEIDSQIMRPYPGYARYVVPWWEVRAFCTDLERARRMAPAMDSEERVEAFGNDTIRLIFGNSVREDFEQEYEGTYVDEVASWITWEEISRNQSADLVCLAGVYRQSNAIDARLLVDDLLEKVHAREVETAFAGGVDIGRTRNTTEIYLGAESTTGSYPLRLAISLDGVEFDLQEATISYILDRLPVHTLLIDRNGLGMQLAENMSKKYPGKAKGFNFDNPNKKVLATDSKLAFQQGRAPIPVDRDLAYQIHSIRRAVSSTGLYVFDTEASEKHHADRFWSHALMLNALGGRRGSSGRVSVVTV